VAAPCLAQSPPTTSPAESAQRDLEALRAALEDRNAPATQRDQAAQRLVSRSSADADAILLRALLNFSDREGQLAVARALAAGTAASPQFIQPLGNLLGNDRELTAAAALALAVHKSSPLARDRLVQFANNLSQQNPSRAAVIRALGRFFDRAVAEQLVNLLNDRSVDIRNAAADALAEMTGIRQYGRDVQSWRTWWESARGKSDLEWYQDLLRYAAQRGDSLHNQLEALRRETEQLQRAVLAQAPPADRQRLMLTWLKADSDILRAMTVQMIYSTLPFQPKLAPEVLQTLRGMVGDSSPEVRERVARTLTAANDPLAAEALLAQLPQEQVPEVRAAIASALGTIPSAGVVDPLLRLLEDESYLVARSAALALGDLSPFLRQPPNTALAHKAAREMEQRFRATTGLISAIPLREGLAEAMARLAHPQFMQVFFQSTGPEERSVRVRVAALRGLGAIGNIDASNQIVLALSDPEEQVRLAAVEALGALGSFDNANALAPYLSDRVEPSAAVRDAVRRVLIGDPTAQQPGLLEKATVKELNIWWAERFKAPTPAERELRLAVLNIAERKLDPEQAEELAIIRQNIGQTLLDLGGRERAELAAARLRQAYDYWSARPGSQVYTEELMGQLMVAMLRAGKSTEAIAFASEVIRRSPQNNEIIYRRVLDEARRLQAANDLDGALVVLETASKMPFSEVILQWLSGLQQEIQQARNRGSIWVQQGGWPGDDSQLWFRIA
jgi:HEAT repeat protein